METEKIVFQLLIQFELIPNLLLIALINGKFTSNIDFLTGAHEVRNGSSKTVNFDVLEFQFTLDFKDSIIFKSKEFQSAFGSIQHLSKRFSYISQEQKRRFSGNKNIVFITSGSSSFHLAFKLFSKYEI